MIKKILLAVALMLPVFGASAQSTLKIGLVDVNAVIQLMPETKEAQTKLAETSKKYDDERVKLEEEMKRKYDELNNMKPDEPNAIKERKTREFQDYQNKVENFLQSAQQDLSRMQQELLAPVIQKIRDAIESVGKEDGYSMIQNYEESLTLYYAAPVVDITPQVKAKLGIK